MENQDLELKLLEVFGHTPDSLQCADAVTGLYEVYENDTHDNPIVLLEIFVSCLTVEKLVELKKLVTI